MIQSITFLIPAMTGTDAPLIQTELEQIPGVRTVEIHEPTRSVTMVWTEPADMEAIWKRLEAMHFTPDFPQPF